MNMTEADICKNLRESKNQKKQIGILADINECKKCDIAKILYYDGEISEGLYNLYIPKNQRRATVSGTDKSKTENRKSNDKQYQPVPETVEVLINDRIKILESVISNSKKERDELVCFLKKDGKKDGVQ